MTIYRVTAFVILAVLLIAANVSQAGDRPGRDFEKVAETTVNKAVDSENYIQQRIGRLLNFAEARLKLANGDALQTFYQKRNNQALWLAREKEFALLLDVLRDSSSHGLNPATYNMTKIVKRIKDGSPKQLAELELLLSDAFLKYARDVRSGRFNPADVDSAWLIEPEQWQPITALQAWESGENLANVVISLPPPYTEYSALRAKLRTFRALLDRGGWPQLEGTEVLEAGDNDAEIAVLRERLKWEQAIPASSLKADPIDADLVKALESAQQSEDGKPTDARLIGVVKNWQKANELKVDGVVGPETGTAIESAIRAPNTQFSPELSAALKQYQTQHGMKPDGVLGSDTRAMLNITAEQRVRQIMLNMERYRWLPRDRGEEFVWVDVAAYRMEIQKNGKTAIEMPVIVGKAGRETPAFSDTMEYLELNPYWNVPVSIAMRDLIPKQAKDPSYFAHKHLRIFEDWSADAREIKPADVDWKGYVGADWSSFKYRLRQDPGPKNSLGQVKFMFPNEYSIYLHDTPHDELFERTVRSFSSGCIRVERPVELAQYLLQDVEYTPLQSPIDGATAPNAGKSTDDFDAWTADALKTRFHMQVNERINLKKPLPVYIVYLTAWVAEDGTMNFRDDVYDRDEAMHNAIRRDGPALTSR